MLKPKKIRFRNILADLARENDFEFGVEVGVHLGKFSEVLLARSRMRKLYLVDPWLDYGRGKYEMEGDDIFAECKARMVKFGKRAKLIREPSPEAVRHFKDDYFDFVFIDGNHKYKAVVADLDAWWPKLKSGGILGCHDYCRRFNCRVIEAVSEFVEKHGLKEYAIIENKKWPTWWTVKE